MGPKFFKVAPIWRIPPKSYVSQLQNELCPRSVASKLSERRPPTWMGGGGNENSQNFAFFCILSISRNFDVASYIWGGTIWKLTSWGFRKCGTFWCLELLKRSYRRSESDDSEIFDLSPKISGVKKKSHGHNFDLRVSPLIQAHTIPICPTVYQCWSLQIKIVAVGFFLDTDTFQNKYFENDRTLGSNNSGLKPLNLKKYHIFGILWTSAFTWYPSK